MLTSAQPKPVQSPPLHGPWPSTSVFGHRWPGPARPAPAATVGAVAVGALIAALSLPLDRGGLGWLVTVLAGAAALVAARRIVPARPTGTVPFPGLTRHRPDPFRYVWAAATVALLGVGTVRAASWLVVLCLLTALCTGALAVAGGRSLRAMALAVLLGALAGTRSPAWLVAGLRTVRRGDRGGGVRITATIGVSVLLLLVFGGLFASADPAFAEMVSAGTPTLGAGTIARWVLVFALAAAVLGGAAFLRAAPPDLGRLAEPAARRVRRIEWAVPLTLLTVLFAMFVVVQLTVLFGGSRHVLDTADLTYADYARGGFWQLLVVTGLTLVVLGGAARWAPRDTRADRVLIRAVLGTLAVLTLVIVASALHRMDLYADTYGLTRLRVLVALCEAWLGLTFLLVLLAGVRLRAAWLPRTVAAAGVLALLGLAVANPDALIVERNLARYQQTGRIDSEYLRGLSADAAPSLDRLPEPARSCALTSIDYELRRSPDDWRGWNLGRERARDLLITRSSSITPSGCGG